ncbi:hypothetical protein S245_055015 [Arachis hypogaea]
MSTLVLHFGLILNLIGQQEHQAIFINQLLTDNHLVHTSWRRESGQILTPVHCTRGSSSTLGAGAVHSYTIMIPIELEQDPVIEGSVSLKERRCSVHSWIFNSR